MRELRDELRRRASSSTVLLGLAVALLGATLYILFGVSWRGSSGAWRFVLLPLFSAGGLVVAACGWLRFGPSPLRATECRSCRYDLRGRSLQSTTCPECGQPLWPIDVPTGQTSVRLLIVALGYLMVGLALLCFALSVLYLAMWRGGALGDI